jgi:hypothetical protein
MPDGEWTERRLRVGSLAEGAKLARKLIERRGRSGCNAYRPDRRRFVSVAESTAMTEKLKADSALPQTPVVVQ